MRILSPELNALVQPPYSLADSAGTGSSVDASHKLSEILQYIQTHCPYANLLGQVNLNFDREGSLCLSGSVSSYYLRQVAVSFALKAAGSLRVNDRLKVEETPRR